jgi:hypothetical protein
MFLRGRKLRLSLDVAQKTHILLFDEPLRELHPKLQTSKKPSAFFSAAPPFVSNIKNSQLRQNSAPAPPRFPRDLPPLDLRSLAAGLKIPLV